MHNMPIIGGSFLLLAVLSLTSCSSRYSSRDQAQKALTEWIKQGGAVTVLTPPDENQIKARWRRERIAENNRCEFAKQGIEDLERTVPPDDFEEPKIQSKHKYLITIRDEACGDRKILVKNEDLTEKQVTKKRECKDNEQLMRFICTEKNVPTKEISKKKWDKWPQKKVTCHINDAEETTSNRQNILMAKPNSPNACTSVITLKTVCFDTNIQTIKS